jgi:hypothetical protein
LQVKKNVEIRDAKKAQLMNLRGMLNGRAETKVRSVSISH